MHYANEKHLWLIASLGHFLPTGIGHNISLCLKIISKWSTSLFLNFSCFYMLYLHNNCFLTVAFCQITHTLQYHLIEKNLLLHLIHVPFQKSHNWYHHLQVNIAHHLHCDFLPLIGIYLHFNLFLVHPHQIKTMQCTTSFWYTAKKNLVYVFIRLFFV